MERHQKKREKERKKRMFKLFYTLLVIEYVVEDQDVSTSVIFPSEYECYEAMGNGVMDDLYDVLADTYDKALNPEQRAEYRFLKQEVDKYSQELNRTNSHPNVEQDLFRARMRLKEFVKQLRLDGVNI